MKDLRNRILETHKNQLELAGGVRWLFEVEIPSDPPTVFRLTNHDKEVDLGPSPSGNQRKYSPFPIALGDILESKKGDLEDLSISVTNVTLELVAHLLEYKGLKGQRITIHLVALDDLASGPQLSHEGKIRHAHVDVENAHFSVLTTNLAERWFPARSMDAYDCGAVFGGSRCGYSIPPSPTEEIGGGFSTCGNVLQDCKVRGLDEAARGLPNLHPLRFDAYPGLVPGGNE